MDWVFSYIKLQFGYRIYVPTGKQNSFKMLALGYNRLKA